MNSVLKSTCLVFLLSIVAACAPKTSSIQGLSQGPQDESGILGGRPVQSNESIAQVTVKVVIAPGDYDQTCTGTLIASNFVLTAAHCAQERPAPAEVVLNDGTILQVSRVTIHPNWSRANDKEMDMRFDFAILELSSDAPSWALLPNRGAQLASGDSVKIAGYGSHLPNDQGYGNLYTLTGSVDPSYSFVEMKVIESPDMGACYGDSGGPVYQISRGNIILWGVDSVEGGDSGEGSPCGTSEIYSKVQAVRNWIPSVAGV